MEHCLNLGRGLVCLATLSLAATATPARPLANHPGNIHVTGEEVVARLAPELPENCAHWRLLDAEERPLLEGKLAQDWQSSRQPVALGKLGAGWYRLEFGDAEQPDLASTTLAVLPALRAEPPEFSPVALDVAATYLAKGDPAKEKAFANLAALAGVKWVRERIDWRRMEPEPGVMNKSRLAEDRAIDNAMAEGLSVLQVFHHTPRWAYRDGERYGDRFAPDLRDVYHFSRQLAKRYQGKVASWEPWNEANSNGFGSQPLDQVASWQKASFLGFKKTDPKLIVGLNALAGIQIQPHADGILKNETWPYFDTYNIHTYRQSDLYLELWKSVREAASGRPIWVSEADNHTPHLQHGPWFDIEPRLERLKAMWIPQSYVQSLFAGSSMHYHFVLPNYEENNWAQFGLLRRDLTPRMGYVALAAVGHYLAGAKILGSWEPAEHVYLYACRAVPDGEERDVLVVWAEQGREWKDRGKTEIAWEWPPGLEPVEVADYLGRPLDRQLPPSLSSAPVFVVLPKGASAPLPLQKPAAPTEWREGEPSPLVLQILTDNNKRRMMGEVAWSYHFAHDVGFGEDFGFTLYLYNFGNAAAGGKVEIVDLPESWKLELDGQDLYADPMGRVPVKGRLRIEESSPVSDSWIKLRLDAGPSGRPVVAFRVVTPAAVAKWSQ